MISPKQNYKIVNYLINNSEKRLVALKLWAFCKMYINEDTNQICLTIKEIAEELDINVNRVSAIMSDLEKGSFIVKQKKGRNILFFL